MRTNNLFRERNYRNIENHHLDKLDEPNYKDNLNLPAEPPLRAELLQFPDAHPNFFIIFPFIIKQILVG